MISFRFSLTFSTVRAKLMESVDGDGFRWGLSTVSVVGTSDFSEDRGEVRVDTFRSIPQQLVTQASREIGLAGGIVSVDVETYILSHNLSVVLGVVPTLLESGVIRLRYNRRIKATLSIAFSDESVLDTHIKTSYPLLASLFFLSAFHFCLLTLTHTTHSELLVLRYEAAPRLTLIAIRETVVSEVFVLF